MLKKLMCGIMIGLALTGAFTALAATNTQTATEGKAAERQMVEAAYNFRYTHLSAKNAVSGNKVTAKAVTAGNSNGVKYKFVVSYNNWESWYVAQYPSTKTSAVITARKAGTYRIYIDAILPNGKVVTKSNAFTVSRPWSLNSVSGPTKGRVGNAIGIAPQVKGSGAGMRYKYVWQKDNWKQWGVIRQFSTAKNASFTPKTPGNYTLYIDAMDAYGNVVTRTKQVTVYNYDVNLKASVVSAKVGGKVNVSASGAPAGSQYKFVASYDNWKHWHVIQDFSTKNTASFAPKYSGSLQVYVDVKYGGNTITRVTPGKHISNRARANWKFNNFALYHDHPDAIKPFYLNTGKYGDNNFPHIFHRDTRKLKANVTGDTKGLQYKFVWSKMNWREWGVIQDFSSSNTAFFTPALFSTGNYDIYVDVKDSYGNVVTQKGSTYVSSARGYYICNSCGFKTSGSSDVMHEHFKNQIKKGIYSCGSYRTGHIHDKQAGKSYLESFYVCKGCGYKINMDDGIAPMHKHFESRKRAGHNECSSYHPFSNETVKYSKNVLYQD